jgi:putative ABC transport system permease protein
MRILVRLLQESFLFAWQALSVNKLRTALSLLGVSIGIFSIIFVLSVVDSLEAEMKDSLQTIGADVVIIQKWPVGPEDGAEEYEWWKYMQRRQPAVADMEKLEGRLTSYRAMAFETGARKSAEYNNSFITGIRATGVSCGYSDIVAVNLSEGRYFTPTECDGGRNVVIIGADVSETLFSGISAIGREIRVGGLKVEVIGVLKREGAALFGQDKDLSVLLPIRFATRLVNPLYNDSRILVRASDGVTSEDLRGEIISVFREVRGIKPGSDSDFSVIESVMLTGIVDSIIGVFNLVGMVIGIFAILVGAFSIANIMFVSVKERTPIIGIQKALGARRSFVLMQFLFEAIALCLVGGALGLLGVWGVMAILNQVMDFAFIMPIFRVLTGFAIAVGVGLVAGLAPALSAARLNPVDAMRAK